MSSGLVVGSLFVVVAMILLVLEWLSHDRAVPGEGSELRPQEVSRSRGAR